VSKKEGCLPASRSPPPQSAPAHAPVSSAAWRCGGAAQLTLAWTPPTQATMLSLLLAPAVLGEFIEPFVSLSTSPTDPMADLKAQLEKMRASMERPSPVANPCAEVRRDPASPPFAVALFSISLGDDPSALGAGPASAARA
jgi:HAMP domain-containing protein